MRTSWRGEGGGGVRVLQRCFVLAPVAALALSAAAAAREPPAPPERPATVAPALRFTPAQAALAVETLRAADVHGLSPEAYVPADLGGGADLSAAQQAALARGLVRYARDVRVGRLALGDFPEIWAVRPQPYDPAPELARALAEGRLEAWIERLPPPYAGYHALRRGLAKYREIAAAGGWEAVPEGPALKLGASGARVAALRARLAAEDPQVAPGGATFDAALHEAVLRAQRRFGIEPDGVVGPGTLAHLNQPVGQRLLQIIANMERWRWLPPKMPATRVQVNSGAAVVTLFRDDQPVLSMKAVSGKPGDETPMLVSAMHSVVINPPWNVPARIASEELWPKQRADPGYFAANDFVVIPTEDGGSRLQQQAGDKAALGRFKFDFDNPFTVYLHDTPSRAAFDRFQRQASHGCVRLEKAQALAEALLAGNPQWSPERIDAALADGETIRVDLPEQVPVYILYWTAFAGADGQMHFRADPYNWDRRLLQLGGVLGQDV